LGNQASSDLRGLGVSPGIAVGPALVVEKEDLRVIRLHLRPEAIEPELARLRSAVEDSRRQLLSVKERLSREVGLPHAYIFDAHLLILDDPLLLDPAFALIRNEGVNAEWALRTVWEQLHGTFEAMSDAYLRERGRDLDDVFGRIQLNLRGAPGAPSLSRLPGRYVLLAADLAPSEAAELDWDRVMAIATEGGSSTDHTAILARSFGIPAVVGVEDATRRVPPGALVVVDGTRGLVVVAPSAPALADFRAEQKKDRDDQAGLESTRALPAEMLDGARVRLRANVEFTAEAGTAVRYGAEGIGLFRSEYLLGRSGAWPGEEQQVEAYRCLLEQMRPHPVTVRTWDVGAEDLAPGGPTSPNPALGARALRLMRRDREPFRLQLRALLRAAVHGPLRIMFPFIGGPDDLRLALELLDQARSELAAEGLDFGADTPVGLALEIPSAAATVDLLAPEVDFFSVGTNDLIQYLLAVDRSDPRVAGLYQPLHPAVLRVLRDVVRVADARGVPVSVCGEMAADPLQALVLVGLGVRDLSMTPSAIPRVKAALRGARAEAAAAAVESCLGLGSAAAVEETLRRRLAAALLPMGSA
jgi:phosphotransferase system enzyme I (PtsI)